MTSQSLRLGSRAAAFVLAWNVALPPLGAQSLALTHVNVVDVVSGSIATDQTILIANGRITTISSAMPPASATVRDYRGRYVIPGLWDMHHHFGTDIRTTFALALANGVTGMRDMGSPRLIVQPRRDSVERGLIAGPRIIAAGPIVEDAGWLTTVRRFANQLGDTSMIGVLAERLPVNTTEGARRAVDSIASLHGDFVKVRNDPPAMATFALLREARRLSLPVAGHWPTQITPETASDSGYHSFEHVPVSVVNRTLLPSFDEKSAGARRALFDRMKRNGTAYTPTLVAGAGDRSSTDHERRTLDDSVAMAGPRLRYASSAAIHDWRVTLDLSKNDQARSAPREHMWASTRRDLREMRDAGVLILAGTDVPILTVPGFALVDEIELLVTKIGFTPVEALRTATINPARYFGAESEFGTVTPGKRADLVVLDGNPLDDIGNLRRVAAVVRAGQLYDRAALDEILRGARRPLR